jgi:hypothetical protein
LSDHDLDIAHMRYAKSLYGGKVARRYPTPDGELTLDRATPPRPQGLPHGFSFVVMRLYNNQPPPILPVFQNTCYPPNQPSPRRSFTFGRLMAQAVREWQVDARVAFVASGGHSHFVVDEEIDQLVLGGLQNKDANQLSTLPRHRLYSATSESLNWVAVGGLCRIPNCNSSYWTTYPSTARLLRRAVAGHSLAGNERGESAVASRKEVHRYNLHVHPRVQLHAVGIEVECLSVTAIHSARAFHARFGTPESRASDATQLSSYASPTRAPPRK